MIRVPILSFALVASLANPAAASQPALAATFQATAGAPLQSANVPDRAPRESDRPRQRDTCERRSGLPIVRLRAGDDRLYGGAAAYQMFGDEGRDFLLGSSEDDEISGGDDADVMVGGGGADLFVYDTRFASLADKKGRWSPEMGDTIVDFEAEDRDKIDLTQLATYGANAPKKLAWSRSGAAEYSVWIIPRDGDTVVAMDLDGDALADSAFRLLGDLRLTASDFCGVASDSG